MEVIANFEGLMRKKKIKNLCELSFITGIDLRDIKRLASAEFSEKDLKIIEGLAEFFDLPISEILVFKVRTNSYLAERNKDLSKKSGSMVYFVRRASDGLVKIGRTKNLSSRLVNLGVETKSDLEVIHYIPTTDSTTLENTLHLVYSDKWVEGEWFKLEVTEIEKFKEKTQSEQIRLERIFNTKKTAATNSGQ